MNEEKVTIKKGINEMAVKCDELREALMLSTKEPFQIQFAMLKLPEREAIILTDAIINLVSRDKLIDIELIPIEITPKEEDRYAEFQLPDHISKSIDEQLAKFNENHLKKVLNRYIELRNNNEVEAAKVVLSALSEDKFTRDGIFMLYNMAATLSTDVIDPEMFYPLLGINA